MKDGELVEVLNNLEAGSTLFSTSVTPWNSQAVVTAQGRLCATKVAYAQVILRIDFFIAHTYT